MSKDKPVCKSGWARSILLWGIGVGLTFALVGLIYSTWYIRSSLPLLNGEVVVSGLTDTARVERDERGVAVLSARNLPDAVMASGWIHAQERLFQMELLRRLGAGELSELFGPALLGFDRMARRAGGRHLAELWWEQMDPQERRLLEAYCLGVNEGIRALRRPPPEFFLFRVGQPPAWTPVDTLLVGLYMYLTLQDTRGSSTLGRWLMEEHLPPEISAYLLGSGSGWDAAADGSVVPAKQIPGGLAWQYLARDPVALSTGPLMETEAMPGSNAWAVVRLSSMGPRVLLAADPHLGFSLPGIYFRMTARFDHDGKARELHGVSIPGVPLVLQGTNLDIAWGFTNSYLGTSQLVRLDPAPGMEDHFYLVPDGVRELKTRRETIAVRGRKPEELVVLESSFGPVLDHLESGPRLALRWIGRHPQALSMAHLTLGLASTVEEALPIGWGAGFPAQNIVLADKTGQAALSVFGLVPWHQETDGTALSSVETPLEWSILAPGAFPVQRISEVGQVWSANHRHWGGEKAVLMGQEGMDVGARASMIRAVLEKSGNVSVPSMVDLQMKNRATFLEAWRSLLLDALAGEPPESDLREEAMQLIYGWSGHASAHDAGYRIVRTFRLTATQLLLDWWLAPVYEAWPGFRPGAAFSSEGVVFQILSEKPAHLVPPGFESWEEWFGSVLDLAVGRLVAIAPNEPLRNRTWGDRNRFTARHPLATAFPWLRPWLALPHEPLEGDMHMPRVLAPEFGAAARYVIDLQHPSASVLQLPGGQSGHWLSPWFRNEFQAWLSGSLNPLLPGPSRHSLLLQPPSDDAAPDRP